MRAVVCTRYGPPDVLELRDLPKPAPKDDELLIRVRAATVTTGDCRVRGLRMPPGFRPIARLALGFTGPRQPILGSELSGVVESIGPRVSRFKVGDEVFAFTGVRLGCHAEYRCLPEGKGVTPKPGALTFDEAAAMSSGGTTALDFFRRARLQGGERVLVNGASGSVGTAAIQLARHFGAEVTGVCSTSNTELVKSLGAHHVIDYTRQDFATNGQTYDVIVDTVGTAPISRTMGSLSERGRLLLVMSGLPDTFQGLLVSMARRRKLIAGPAAWRPADLGLLAELAAAGEFKPVIDRRYPLERIAEAHRYVDAGHKKGNVVITVAEDG